MYTPTLTSKTLLTTSALLLLLAAGCSDPTASFDYALVVDRIQLPGSKTTAPGGGEIPDSRLAQLLTVLDPFLPAGWSPQDGIDDIIGKGHYIMLLRLRTTSLRDETDLTLTLGPALDTDALAGNNFSGSALLAPSAGVQRRLAGSLRGGSLEAGPGAMVMPVPVGKFYPELLLRGVRLTGQLVPSGLQQGRINGAIPLEGREGGFYWSIAASLNAIYKDPQPPATSLSTLLASFDADKSGQISSGEVADHPLVRLLARPDVDSDGDGAPDALSAALGFTAVPCRIQDAAR